MSHVCVIMQARASIWRSHSLVVASHRESFAAQTARSFARSCPASSPAGMGSATKEDASATWSGAGQIVRRLWCQGGKGMTHLLTGIYCCDQGFCDLGFCD
jgi:hypothetical protein